MIPLCTTAIVPSSLTCGCALTWFGGPCVAQRVCAMPVVPCTGLAASIASRREIFPASFTRFDAHAVHDRDAGRVVAAVLEPLQPLEQQGCRESRSHVSDDSTHEAIAIERCQATSASSGTRQRAISSLASASVGASAMTRTIGSVPDGRT